jgi:hypothetical protein
MADDKIVLFPTDRIKNKENIGATNPKEHQKLVEEQTKEFVEGTVDDIAYTLLDKFLNAGIKTKEDTFMIDLSLVIDSIRGLIYRDFKKYHPAQALADKMVNIKVQRNGQKNAKLDYSKVIDTKHKPHKPLSEDVQKEVKDLSDMDGVEFIPDFDPNNDN